jgi:hypothetical protein
MCDANKIIDEVNVLEAIYLRCRSVFPAITEDMIGRSQFKTAPYYKVRGYDAIVELNNPITADFIKHHRRIVKWLNENAIIRLYGIMYHHCFFKNNINQQIEGWREVDLLRRMRNVFTKTILNYQPNDNNNIRLREEVIKHFKLNEDSFVEGEIPTPVDTVIQPIFEGCRKYIKKKCTL